MTANTAGEATQTKHRFVVADGLDVFYREAGDPGRPTSSFPSAEEFDHSFESFYELIVKSVDELGLERFSIHIQDYGAPIGLRVAERNPERVQAIVTQSGNAYLDGNGEIQLGLFRDYKNKLDGYPDFQQYFRNHRPPTLIVWGKREELDFIAERIRDFLGRHVG